MNNRCTQYLNKMDIVIWRRRQLHMQEVPVIATHLAASEIINSIPESSEFSPSDTQTPVMTTTSVSSETMSANAETIDWQTLKTRVTDCIACELHKTRTQTVFGVGNREADWLIVGEAPGADEDAQGEPFVGRAGQLLNAMLYAIGLPREMVYIANVLKCRPPDNRNPAPEEMRCCTPFLQQQIALINPKIILALGSVAAQYLLATDTPIGKLRGKCYRYGNRQVPLLATYHPAYLLRKPTEKRKAWQDLQRACQIVLESRKNA